MRATASHYVDAHWNYTGLPKGHSGSLHDPLMRTNMKSAAQAGVPGLVRRILRHYADELAASSNSCFEEQVVNRVLDGAFRNRHLAAISLLARPCTNNRRTSVSLVFKLARSRGSDTC